MKKEEIQIFAGNESTEEKESLTEKGIWVRLRIRGKKDWAVFWIFAGLLCYVLGGRFQSYRIKDWLFQSSSPYMTNLNDPAPGWGCLMTALVLLAVVGEIVLILCKRNRKGVIAMAVLLAGACVVPFAVRGLYRVHTYLIVSSLWKENPQTVSVWFLGKDQETGQTRYGFLDEDLSKEQKQELLEFCKNMTMISDENKLKHLEEWYRETPAAFMDSTNINIKYNRKYGHSYSFNLSIYEGKIFIWRGNGKQPVQYVTFFEDNGLIEWLEELSSD